jgi:hypothetical protein
MDLDPAGTCDMAVIVACRRTWPWLTCHVPEAHFGALALLQLPPICHTGVPSCFALTYRYGFRSEMVKLSSAGCR